MKDLKHIRYFESLLEQANNALAQQAKAEGGVAVGYTTCCYQTGQGAGKALDAAL